MPVLFWFLFPERGQASGAYSFPEALPAGRFHYPLFSSVWPGLRPALAWSFCYVVTLCSPATDNQQGGLPLLHKSVLTLPVFFKSLILFEKFIVFLVLGAL
ncbi:hypothetical protein RJ614_03770 [Klebsiella pneumoniae]|nr:hypothetical protein [Klebsiella pneumoniae]